MTNAQIIFAAEQQLAEAGKIRYTGRTFKAIVNDEEVDVPETEMIHTYAEWKKLGFQVQKGQKAIAQFEIWMHTGARTTVMENEKGERIEAEDSGHYYRKKASFFAAHQVALA